VPEKNSGKREKLIVEAVPATEFLVQLVGGGLRVGKIGYMVPVGIDARCCAGRVKPGNLFRCQIPSYRLQILA
jgi:hypothetical protein